MMNLRIGSRKLQNGEANCPHVTTLPHVALEGEVGNLDGHGFNPHLKLSKLKIAGFKRCGKTRSSSDLRLFFVSRPPHSPTQEELNLDQPMPPANSLTCYPAKAGLTCCVCSEMFR